MRALLEIQKEGCQEELQGWWHLGARLGVQRYLTAWRAARGIRLCRGVEEVMGSYDGGCVSHSAGH